jgi:hypothetical protein
MIHTDLVDPSDPMQRCIANISSPIAGGLVQIDNGNRPPEKPFDIVIFVFDWLFWAIIQIIRIIFWLILGAIAFCAVFGVFLVVDWCVAYWTGRTGWLESVAKWLQSVGDSCMGSVSGMKQTFKEWWQNRGRQQGDYDGVPVEMDEQGVWKDPFNCSRKSLLTASPKPDFGPDQWEQLHRLTCNETRLHLENCKVSTESMLYSRMG